MRKVIALSVALMLALLVGQVSAAAEGAPSVKIVSPADGATVSGDLLVVQAQVSNFSLNPVAIGTAPKPGEGHWHIYVDGKLAGLSADGVVSVPNDAFPTLTAGQHTITVDLHNNDHTPVAGSTGDKITVNVAHDLHYAAGAGPAGVRFVSPTNGAAVGQHVIVQAAVSGFKLDPVAVGTAPKAGEGHWHLYVDGKLAGLSASSVADATLTPGTHTLRVDLHNNDHTPVTGSTGDEITVNVAASLPKTGASPAFLLGGFLLVLLGVALAVRPRWHAS